MGLAYEVAQMNERRQEMEIGFTQEIIPDYHHLCLIYDDEGQRRKIVSEYLAVGVKRGEIVRYFTDTTVPNDIRAWLLEMGIEPKDDDSYGATLFKILQVHPYMVAQGRIVRIPFYIKPDEFLANQPMKS